MAPIGVNDMHAMHVGSKIVHAYVQPYLLVWVILSQVSLKRRRAELHIDTKNKTECAEMTDVEMTNISAAYGWGHPWIGGKSVTIKLALGHL